MRIFSIELSCGCLISLNGGGNLVPCKRGKDCKYFEEFLYNKRWPEWKLQTYINDNNYLTEWEIEEKKREIQNEYDERMNQVLF